MKQSGKLLPLSVATPIITLFFYAFCAYLLPNRPEKAVSDKPCSKSAPSHNVPPGLSAAIAAREYHISYDRARHVLQSPNRKHNLRACYRPGTLTIQNRIDSSGRNFSLVLKNEGIMADGNLIDQPDSTSNPEILENRLLIRHAKFTEEFINNADGVRQNFIVHAAPAGTKELKVKLAARGLSIRNGTENELQFFAADGQARPRLIYRDLQCWDAQNRPLSAQLTSKNQQIFITVDVRNAAYPVTIDPIAVNGSPANADALLESDQAEALMGFSVASAGDVNADGYSDVIIGARYYTNGQGEDAEGAAFIYRGNSGGLEASPTIIEGNQYNAALGNKVSSAGDVNGDGFSDIIVGASEYDSGQPNSGAAYVYYGAPWGIDVNSVTKIEHIQGSHLLGYSVSGAGDVNGDGYADIIIGDPAYFVSWDPQKGLIEGAALIFYGSNQGINLNTFSVLKNTDQTQCSFGWVVANAGDVNGDSYDDVIVGDPNYDIQFDEGAAFIYHGSNQGIATTPAIMVEGNQEGEELGFSVASAGDVNEDGFDDIIVGIPFYSNSQTSEGAVRLLYGSASGIGNTSVTLENNISQAWMGYSVSSAGDVNGDGYTDIIVGCPTSQAGEGITLIYYGSLNGINDNSLKTTVTISSPSYFGNSVSNAGDYNGDGYGDVVIGAINYSPTNTGSAFMYFGSPTGIYSQSPTKFESNVANSEMGTSVTCAGDINGDGYSDILVGAPFYNSTGSAFLYNGGNCIGTRNNLRLYNTDLTTPITHTQFPEPNFGAGLFAKSFTGRSKGKLIWETKPLAQGFSKGSNNRITNSTQSTGSQNAYSNLGTTGLELKNVIDKQGPGTKVRVRVKYDPVLALTGQSYGPWRYLPAYLMGNSTAPVPEEGNDLSEYIKRERDLEESDTKTKLATIYPNPVSDRLNINFKDNSQVQSLRIVTAAGSLVYQSTRFQSFVDVSKFPEGTYSLIITKKDGSHDARRILIRR